MKRLAVITTHPVQYNAPIFQLLAKREKVAVKVFYTWGEEVLQKKFDQGFNRHVEWDVPLLHGYEHEFLENTAKTKGSHHFWGIKNPNSKQRIQQWKPDALLVIGWSFESHLRILRWAAGRYKVFFRGDSTLLNENESSLVKKNIRKFFLRWVYQNIDCALYTGESNKAYYEHLNVKEDRLLFAPHAIDNARFWTDESSLEEEAKEWRSKLGIRETDTVFLFSGKLERVKNTVRLLEAFMQLGLPDCHLIFCGSGPLQEELKTKAEKETTVHFIGFQNQLKMPVVYRLADLFILPSVSETWGLAVNEAMACSRSVLVSTKCGCALDLVKDGVNGYTFNPNDENELIQKLKLVYAQKTALKKMGMSSRELVQKFSVQEIVGSIEGLLSNE